MLDIHVFRTVSQLKINQRQAYDSVEAYKMKDQVMAECIIELDVALQNIKGPSPAFMAEHLQKLIAAIESETPDENLTRSVSEAKAALSFYQVTL